jgi:hypothetical protein
LTREPTSALVRQVLAQLGPRPEIGIYTFRYRCYLSLDPSRSPSGHPTKGGSVDASREQTPQRRIRTLLILVTVAASLGAGWIAASPASARGDPRAFIYDGKSDCGTNDRHFPRIGNVRASRDGTTFTVIVTLAGASPSTPYYVELFDTACAYLANMGEIITDANGNAGPTPYNAFALTTSSTRFFVSLQNVSTNAYNDTTPMTMH